MGRQIVYHSTRFLSNGAQPGGRIAVAPLLLECTSTQEGYQENGLGHYRNIENGFIYGHKLAGLFAARRAGT